MEWNVERLLPLGAQLQEQYQMSNANSCFDCWGCSAEGGESETCTPAELPLQNPRGADGH